MTRVLIVNCQNDHARALISNWPNTTDELFGFDAPPVDNFQRRIRHVWGLASHSADIVRAFERAHPHEVLFCIYPGMPASESYRHVTETAQLYGATVRVVEPPATEDAEDHEHSEFEIVRTGVWRCKVPGGWLYRTSMQPGAPTTFVPRSGDI